MHGTSTPSERHRALTEALREGGHLPAGKVITASPTDVGTGRGYVCQTLRLEIEYEGAPPTAPGSLVAKIPTVLDVDPSYNEFLAQVQTSELSFYRDLADECPVRVPVPYWVGLAPAEGRYCLIMEDLGQFRAMSQGECLSDETAALAVDALARTQARWWDDPQLMKFDWLVPPATNGANMQFFYSMAWPFLVEQHGAVLDPPFMRAVEWLADHAAEAAVRWSQPHSTLIHGDYRIENFLFGEPGTPDAIVVLDWQLVSRGGGLYDLAYFLGQSVDPCDRRRLERDMVHRYHEGLLAGGVTGYTRDECWDDYRRGLLLASYIPVNGVRSLAITPPPEDPDARSTYDAVMEAGAALVDLILSRSAAAIVETEAYQFAV